MELIIFSNYRPSGGPLLHKYILTHMSVFRGKILKLKIIQIDFYRCLVYYNIFIYAIRTTTLNKMQILM